MYSSHFSHRMFNKPAIVGITISILVLVCLSGSLAGCSRKTPTPTVTATQPIPTKAVLPSPTPLPLDLPPALVETNPLLGAQLVLDSPLTFYFNQPMDRPSVEAAISGDPILSGSFTWLDDSSLTFTPDTPFMPGTSQTINIDTSAHSAKGMALLEPIQLTYTTIDYLNLVQELPAGGTSDVDPTSAIVASFNQPVVPLGADPASLPAGFNLTPTADGRGEWINTSTYIFYAEPAMAGGENYQVSINPDLTSTGGSPLESAPGWSFDTALPRLVSTLPLDEQGNLAPGHQCPAQFQLSHGFSQRGSQFFTPDQ